MRRRVLLPLIVASLLVPAVAAAQDAPEPITWIAFSKTKPGKGQEAVQNILKWDKGIYDKLLADGDALSWGIGIPINHWPGDNWDLALWVTMPDWSKVGVLQKGFEDAFRSRSPEQQKQAMADWEATVEPNSHYDWIVRHVVFSAAESPKPARYIYLGHHKAKPGKGRDTTKLYKETAVPVLDKAIAQGLVSGYGLYVQELHGDPSWTHTWWRMLPDLASIDKVDQLFNEAAAGRSDWENTAVRSRWRENLDWERHHDRVLLIVHQGGQEAE